jgi:hypothetical protein
MVQPGCRRFGLYPSGVALSAFWPPSGNCFGVRFGAFEQEWTVLQSEENIEIKRASESAERILGNIEKGFVIAAT